MDGDGATAVLESPVAAQTEVAQTTPEATSQPAKTTPESTQSTPDKTDKRQQPDAMRKYLKGLRDSGGEHTERVQELERALGENKSFKSVIPTVREARELKTVFDAIAPEAKTTQERIAKLAEMTRVTSHVREVDGYIAAGDERALPMVLETPEDRAGVAKLLPGLIRELSTSHSAEVKAAIQPHAISYMRDEGLPGQLKLIVEAFKAGKTDDAATYIDQIVGWYNEKSQGKQDTVKPAEQQAWEKERDTFQQKAFEAEINKASESMNTYAWGKICAAVDPQLKQQGIPLDSDYANLIRQDVWKAIEKKRNSDPLFQAASADHVNVKAKKVSPSWAQYLNSQTDAHLRDAVRQELSKPGRFLAKAKPQNGNGPEVKANPTAPPASASIEIDHEMTARKAGGRAAAQDMIMQNKAFNSAGKPIKKVGRVWQLA
jgi:hypothetical protein